MKSEVIIPEYPKCPDCNELLKIIDTEEMGCCEEIAFGYCPKCRYKYEWMRCYEYAYFVGLERDRHNEIYEDEDDDN